MNGINQMFLSSWLPPGGSRGEVAAAGSIQRTAHFRQFLGGCAARVANLATRWREAPLASPGGKLLSEARLMRGDAGWRQNRYDE